MLVTGRLARRLIRSERGQALVEFAFVLPVLLLLILGLFDVARAVEQENTLAFAAREGTRYAIVHGSASSSPVPYCSSCTNSTITKTVQNAAISVNGTLTVTVGYPDGDNKRGSRVSVQATAPFVPLPSQWLLNGALSVTLRGGSELVIEY
jgi:Flp pilus assembly protein TadG